MTVKNFLSGDEISGVDSSKIKSADSGTGKITYTLNDGKKIEIAGTGVVLTESDYKDAKAKDSNKTNASSDTFVWTKEYYVEVKGIGKYTYKTATKETEGSGTAPKYEERFEDEYAVIVAPETLFGGSEFDEVLPAGGTVEVKTADLLGDFDGNFAGGFKAGDIVTPAVDKSKKTE